METPQLRASQMITTFGPGAMVDLPEQSVIVGGLDGWRYDLGDIPMVVEPRLAAKVAIVLGRPAVALRAPPPSSDLPTGPKTGVTVWQFPEWFVVQRPKRVASGYRRRLVRIEALDNGKFFDPDERKKIPVVPVRFVRGCTAGHVGDIDWRALVHGGSDPACRRELWIEERGTSGDLAEVHVVCECGKEQCMSVAADRNRKALGFCDGSRPWLGPRTREGCHEQSRLLIRSASNAYFPQIMSVISIPDRASELDRVVRTKWEAGLKIVTDKALLTSMRTIESIGGALNNWTDEEVLAAIQRIRKGDRGEDRPVKEAEFEALMAASGQAGSYDEASDFMALRLPANVCGKSAWANTIDRVVLVHRLREVVALLGFTRFEAASTDKDGELDVDVRRAALATDADWVPAVENRGEGIFLALKSDKVTAWLERPEVKKRGQELEQGFKQWLAEHENAHRVFPGLPYIMLHSLAHALLTAVALECGYSASALRERVYALDGIGYGILIYTGTSDAEGTLGGLVQTGREIARHMRHALESVLLCSNDPVCGQHTPTADDGQPLLGGACHGCLLISETSCEQHNEFLDRALLVPTVGGCNAEFFEGIA